MTDAMLESDKPPRSAAPLRRSLLMLRRSISLNARRPQEHLDALRLKESVMDDSAFLPEDCKRPKLERRISVGDHGRSQRHVSVADGASAASAAARGLAPEMDVGPLAASLFDSCFDAYVRCILVPVVVIFLAVYTFFQLPVQPRAEIYRSLSATFVLLVGIVVQCSLLTLWASRRYGLAELIIFLRYCLQAPRSPQS